MIKFFFIVSLFFLFSCSSKKDEKEIVPEKTDSAEVPVDTLTTIDTIIPVEQTITLDNIPSSKAVNDRLRYFKEKYTVNYTETNPQQLKVYVLDRFGSDKKYKIHLQKKMPVKYGKVEGIFPVINIHAYAYVDSAQCANAVNNWFNCFGNDCNTIKLNENTMIKSTPGFYIINPTSIICLDYLVEHAENNWSDVTAHLKKLFATKGSILIYVKPQGKLSWEQK